MSVAPEAPPAPPRRERWTLAAFVLAALAFLLMLYVGSRPGGRGALLAWSRGVPAVGIAAGLLGLFGLVRCVVARPFLRPGRMPAFLVLGVLLWGASAPIPYPSSYEGRPSGVRFRLPVEGEWRVRFGGDVGRGNLLEVRPDRRWGLHLVVERGGSTRADSTGPGQGAAPEDFLCFDRPVLAPAAGEVVAVLDGQPDRGPAEPFRAEEPLGNHVVLRVAPGQFAFLANLRQGSVLVRPGQRVEVGEPIGRVGSSGGSRITPEPHLAVHLQDTAVPRWGEAIPWRFVDYVADGERVAERLPEGWVGTDGRLLGQRIRAGS